MTSKVLLCCLEERSARLMLDAVLNRVLPADWQRQYIVFEGKKDLLNRLEFRLRGWQTPNTSVLVLCDQDAQDCREIKSGLLEKVKGAHRSFAYRVRIACHELENFYLGDLAAVEQGLHVTGLVRLALKNPYRNPDAMTNAPEQLKKITGSRYQKCVGSESIAPYLDLDGRNKSQSFNMLVSAIRQLTEGTASAAQV